MVALRHDPIHPPNTKQPPELRHAYILQVSAPILRIRSPSLSSAARSAAW